MKNNNYSKKTSMVESLFSNLFERKHPYALAAYLGRKNAEDILECRIEKKKRWSEARFS